MRFGVTLPHGGIVGSLRRAAALADLTLREATRSRVLFGLTALMVLLGFGALLWPADQDAERVILVQRRCFEAMTFFGLIVAAFLAGSSIPADISSRRIYSLATKPVSRFELLLGKTLGLICVIFIFLALGAAITIAVAHVASLRKTYAGGSYTLEVVEPSVELKTGKKTASPVVLTQGQLLTADGEADGGYEVTIAQRDTRVSGVIPESAVRLHVRSLAPQRVAEPAEAYATGKGTARAERGELILTAGELAPGDAWIFQLPPAQSRPEGLTDIPVRMVFSHFQHEPSPLAGTREGRRARVKLLFRDPVSREQILREVDFTVRGDETAGEDGKARRSFAYEEIFVLPRSVLSGDAVEMQVVDYSPMYPQRGRVYFGAQRSPVWRFKELGRTSLPSGQQTLRARFFVYYVESLELVDAVDVTAEIRNPATGEKMAIPVTLRDRTTTHIRFPRRLVDDRQGVELTFPDLPDTHHIGHDVKEPPVYLLLTPDFFWASTARSVLLIFLNLAVFTTLAVAASTFLSAPVAILLVMVIALAGAVKDMVLAARPEQLIAPPNPFVLAAQGAATLQEAVSTWVKYLLTQALVALAPGFHRFSSADYISRGWSVPWSAVGEAAIVALAYTAAFFCLGHLFFRTREFE